MFRIAPQATEAARRAASELRSRFPLPLGAPASLLLLTASPPLLGAHTALLNYYGGHPRLGFELLAAIRLIAARELGAPDCLDHARRTLRACGLSERQIDSLPEVSEDGVGSVFEAEAGLLRFVRQALSNPASVDDGDLERLRLAGWDDATILDALALGAAVQAPALLLRALRR